MSDPNRPARLNRGLLVALGIVLLAAGAFTLLTGLGVLHVLRPDATLVVRGVRTQPWVPYVVAAAAIVLGLLCLRWLAAQGIRRPRTGTWRMEDDPERGTTLLAANTATAPLVADIQTYHGVHTANAWLCGDRDTPLLRLTVAAEPEADLPALRERIATHAVFRLRQALELPALPTSVQFRIAPGKPTRHRTEVS
jgi:hypothetical protein